MLAGQGFSGISQRGTSWVLRAGRVDDRRFVVLIGERKADRKRLREAITAARGGLAGALAMIDAVSPNRLAGLADLFSSVTELGITGLTDA